jgi:hypothetical protein
MNIEDLPTLPTNSVPWTVGDKFTIFNNNDGKGCYLAGGFTLVPREFVKYVFDKTKQFFAAFEKILKVHKNLDPRGDAFLFPSSFISTPLHYNTSLILSSGIIPPSSTRASISLFNKSCTSQEGLSFWLVIFESCSRESLCC